MSFGNRDKFKDLESFPSKNCLSSQKSQVAPMEAQHRQALIKVAAPREVQRGDAGDCDQCLNHGGRLMTGRRPTKIINLVFRQPALIPANSPNRQPACQLASQAAGQAAMTGPRR